MKEFLVLGWVMLIHMILFNLRIIFPLRNISRSIYPFSDGGYSGCLRYFCFSSSAMSLAMTSWHLLVCVLSLSGVDILQVPPLQSVTEWNLVLLWVPLPLMRDKSAYSTHRAQHSAQLRPSRLAGAHPPPLPVQSPSPLLEAAGPQPRTPHHLAPPALDPYTWPSSPDPTMAPPAPDPHHRAPLSRCRGSGPPQTSELAVVTTGLDDVWEAWLLHPRNWTSASLPFKTSELVLHSAIGIFS